MTIIETPVRTELTETEARKLLARAVEERGADFVYVPTAGNSPRCWYQKEDGTPDCLIGLALSYIGPIPENNSGGAQGAIVRLYPNTKQRVLGAMNAAQAAQDNGRTWGEALAAFDNYITQIDSVTFL